MSSQSDTDEAPVLVEATPQGVVTVTLNRPQKKNAFDARLISALSDTFQTLAGASGVRVIFIQGARGMFCAGADLDWMAAAAERTEADNRADAMEMAKMFKALWDLPALTVALIEGGAFGGGAGLAAACDVAIATSSSRFSFSEVRLGLIAATISPYVVAAIGPRTARALLATGQVFDATHAERVGLISQCVADADGLTTRRDELIKTMNLCAPGAVADSKALVADIAHRPIESVMDETARRIARARVGDEGREGVAAFLSKRQPNWVLP